MSILFIDTEPGDTVEISGPARITFEEKTGRRSRIKIEAAKTTQVTRLGVGQLARKNKQAQDGLTFGDYHG